MQLVLDAYERLTIASLEEQGAKQVRLPDGTGLSAVDEPCGKVVNKEAAQRLFPAVKVIHVTADALLLAAMAADFYGEPLAVVPESHRAALRGVKGWPEVLPEGSTPPPAVGSGVLERLRG